MKVLGQNRLDNLLRNTDVEPVSTSASREIDFAKHGALRVKTGNTLLDTRGQKRPDETQALEEFERARMHDRRPIPG